MIAFGPIPSRRLGRSLGVNNIPPKVCTYSCVYCQLGRTIRMQVDRRPFYAPEEVLRDVREQVEKSHAAGERIDYLTFVPDGEPTLDVNLGREIELLRPLSIPIAVITNGSLLWREDVQEDLAGADWVSLKVDSAREPVWRRTDRPHGSLRLPVILEGLLSFARFYEGTLVTETMLVEGVNDDEASLREVAEFLARLKPARAYISVPTRPPAEKWVRPPSEEAILRAHQILASAVGEVELLIGYEGDAFAATGDAREDLLRITAVHPMRREAVEALLARTGAGWEIVGGLVDEGLLVETEYEGHTYYMARITHHASRITRHGGKDVSGNRVSGR
ncbi:MAG TPA: radical SAM protein [Chloroflexi bacterium]|nr:radical SAM protein [Chloroflexota bacterium]